MATVPRVNPSANTRVIMGRLSDTPGARAQVVASAGSQSITTRSQRTRVASKKQQEISKSCPGL